MMSTYSGFSAWLGSLACWLCFIFQWSWSVVGQTHKFSLYFMLSSLGMLLLFDEFLIIIFFMFWAQFQCHVGYLSSCVCIGFGRIHFANCTWYLEIACGQRVQLGALCSGEFICLVWFWLIDESYWFVCVLYVRICLFASCVKTVNWSLHFMNLSRVSNWLLIHFITFFIWKHFIYLWKLVFLFYICALQRD